MPGAAAVEQHIFSTFGHLAERPLAQVLLELHWEQATGELVLGADPAFPSEERVRFQRGLIVATGSEGAGAMDDAFARTGAFSFHGHRAWLGLRTPALDQLLDPVMVVSRAIMAGRCAPLVGRTLAEQAGARLHRNRDLDLARLQLPDSMARWLAEHDLIGAADLLCFPDEEPRTGALALCVLVTTGAFSGQGEPRRSAPARPTSGCWARPRIPSWAR